MKEMKIGTYISGEENYTFTFYTDLSTSEKLKFVNSVTSLLVDGENYNSIIRNLLFDFYLIDLMTEIDTSDFKKSNYFVNDVEQFLEKTNIVDIIKANVESGLIEELNEAIDLNIRYKTGIHPNPLNEALTSLVNALESKLNSFDMTNAMEMASKFSGMTEDFTPENIVKAYLHTDIHKKNLDEIAEAKSLKNEIEMDEDLGEAIRTVVEDKVVGNIDNVIDFVDKK